MAFIDARTLPDGSRISADLVIVGGGIAGITLARELAGGPLKVAVLESGGRDLDTGLQDLYAGSGVMRGPDNPDRPFDDYPEQSRARVLGGSGMVWGGKCAPLDPADFERRDWIPHSGWPVSRSQLQPFYDRACDHLDIPRFPAADPRLSDPRRPRLEVNGEREFFSSPRVFTRCSGRVDMDTFDRFRTTFAEAPNITVYLHANVTRIRESAGRDRIEGLDIGCMDGKRHSALAARYVLATGGIENARLLLASDVGNRHDLVGRFFQGHVTFADDEGEDRSAIHVSGGQSLDLYLGSGRHQLHCVFAHGLEGQKRRRTGNFTITSFPSGPSGGETKAIRQLATRLDGGTGEGQTVDCFLMTEHMPNPESRVTLAAEKDALGLPRVHLEWVWSKADLDGLEACADAFGDALGAGGQGRFCWPGRRNDLVAMAGPSRHHIGTTRMNADPRQGVVDTDSRVHGLANLYVAGSSVFPTSGIANPTLTLMALTVRLADHLRQGAAA